MKDKFTTIILFFIMLILIGAIGVFAIAIYSDIINVDKSGTIYATKPIETGKEEKDKAKEKNNTIANANISTNTQISENENIVEVGEIYSNNTDERQGYFYLQLSDTQRQIYDGLYANKENMMDGTYEVHYGGIFSDVLKKENGKELLSNDYQSAVEAFLYDNPDVFYVDANKLYLNVQTTNKIFQTTYSVYIKPEDNSTYYVEGFKSKQQVQQAKIKIEDVRDNILATLSGDTYKDILKIHDYLVDSIKYDEELKGLGRYNIYGALVNKKCVCEGYAKAFKYLLDAANIPCVLVQGTAKNSANKTESHAWNCVELEGKWYYMDVTWDDPIIIGTGSLSKSVQYKYFLKGNKTMSKNHKLSYQFSDGGKVFKYPICSEKDYK